ncbi:uncharacterized protein LOC103744742 [Nannospalax galili]|uniref:uncharacterized protein LOC103744742 n=1 Tax=Nannospalax galili TaxID=1026970 RepID=UPI00111C6F40|nr:uncharacterized protein LOC103744742 [Nannospalax galili]
MLKSRLVTSGEFSLSQGHRRFSVFQPRGGREICRAQDFGSRGPRPPLPSPLSPKPLLKRFDSSARVRVCVSGHALPLSPRRASSWRRGLSCSAIARCSRITGATCSSRVALLTASYRGAGGSRAGNFHAGHPRLERPGGQ